MVQPYCGRADVAMHRSGVNDTSVPLPDVLWTTVHDMRDAIVVFFGDRYYGAYDVLSDEVVVCDHDGHGHREPAAC